MIKTKNKKFGNIVGHVKGVKDMSSLAEWTSKQFDPSLCWEDVLALRKRWPGKLILKGIMDEEDAKAFLVKYPQQHENTIATQYSLDEARKCEALEAAALQIGLAGAAKAEMGRRQTAARFQTSTQKGKEGKLKEKQEALNGALAPSQKQQ